MFAGTFYTEKLGLYLVSQDLFIVTPRDRDLFIVTPRDRAGQARVTGRVGPGPERNGPGRARAEKIGPCPSLMQGTTAI